jgi:hypothetical protein
MNKGQEFYFLAETKKATLLGGFVLNGSLAVDCMDAGGRATQEQLPSVTSMDGGNVVKMPGAFTPYSRMRPPWMAEGRAMQEQLPRGESGAFRSTAPAA